MASLGTARRATATTASPKLKRPRPSSASSSLAPPEAHHATLPKTLRLLLRTLLANHIRLLTEFHLLSKLWYKGCSQFRTAIWWKHTDALRRCLLRLLGSLSSSPSVLALHSAENPQARLHKTSDAVIAALCSLFGVPPPSNIVAHRRNRTIPNFTTPPTRLDRIGPSSPPIDPFTTAARETHTLALLLHETRKRARSAYTVAAIHLRTPPAPTFAPQVAILLAVAASIERIATDTVLGVESEGNVATEAGQQDGARVKNGVERLYRILRGVVVDGATDEAEGQDEAPTSSKKRTLASPPPEAVKTTVDSMDEDDTAPPRPKGKRPSKHRRNQLRKARLAATKPHAAASSRHKQLLRDLPETIPDPFPLQSSSKVSRHTSQRQQQSKSSTPLPFDQAAEAFHAKRTIKNASKFFSRPVSLTPPVILGATEDAGDGDDLGEAIAR